MTKKSNPIGVPTIPSMTVEEIEALKNDAFSAGKMEGIESHKIISRSVEGFSTTQLGGDSPSSGYLSPAEILMSGNTVQAAKDKKVQALLKEIKTSRYLGDTNVYKARWQQLASARMVGKHGPTPLTKMIYNVYENGKQVTKVHDLASRLVAQSLVDFFKAHNIDVAGLRDWNNFVFEDIGTGLVRDGNVLWLVHTFDPNAIDALNGYGTALQQLDSLYVARELTVPWSKTTGTRINSGVELNKWGRQVAIYLDFDTGLQSSVGIEVVQDYVKKIQGRDSKEHKYLRIPVFDPKKVDDNGITAMYYHNDPAPLPEQVHGRPWDAVAFTDIYSINTLKGYLQVATRAGASKSMVVTSKADSPAPGNNILHNKQGKAYGVAIKPGSVTFLDDGQDIKAIDFDLPYDGTREFIMDNLRGISAALAVPFAALSNNYSESTFAAEHSASVDNNRLWTARRAHVQTNLLEPFIQFWFKRCVRAGIFKYGSPEAPEEIDRTLMESMAHCITFQFDVFEAQSPLEQEQAAQLRLKMGTSSIYHETLRNGLDPDAVIEHRIEEVNKFKEHGILVDNYTFFPVSKGSSMLFSEDPIALEKEQAQQELDAKVSMQKEVAMAKLDKETQTDTEVKRSLTDLTTLVNTNLSVQRSVLQDMGSLEEQLAHADKDALLPLIAAALAALAAPKEEKPINRTTIRRHSVQYGEDGLPDLNTLTVLEEEIEVVPTTPVIDTTVGLEDTVVESTDAVDTTPVVEPSVEIEPVVDAPADSAEARPEDEPTPTPEVAEKTPSIEEVLPPSTEEQPNADA